MKEMQVIDVEIRCCTHSTSPCKVRFNLTHSL